MACVGCKARQPRVSTSQAEGAGRIPIRWIAEKLNMDKPDALRFSLSRYRNEQ
jgi:hypothetical protein